MLWLNPLGLFFWDSLSYVEFRMLGAGPGFVQASQFLPSVSHLLEAIHHFLGISHTCPLPSSHTLSRPALLLAWIMTIISSLRSLFLASLPPTWPWIWQWFLKKKKKSKAETTNENIGKLDFIRMKDLYASKDTIKWHQGREQRKKYQDSISAPRQWWQKLSGNYLEILESQFPWKGSQFPGKGLDAKSWLISGNFSLNSWLDVLATWQAAIHLLLEELDCGLQEPAWVTGLGSPNNRGLCLVTDCCLW